MTLPELDAAAGGSKALRRALKDIQDYLTLMEQALGLDPHFQPATKGDRTSIQTVQVPPRMPFTVEAVPGGYIVDITLPKEIRGPVLHEIKSSLTLPFLASVSVNTEPLNPSTKVFISGTQARYFQLRSRYLTSNFNAPQVSELIDPIVIFATSNFWVNIMDAPYNAVGDGVTDDSPAFDAAFAYAKAHKKAVYVPSASVGFLCTTPWDLHDTDQMTIFGDGYLAPAFGLALTVPEGGSIVIFNTGIGNCMVDALGATSLQIRDITLISVGQLAPATVGIICGTSDRVDAPAPGSAPYVFRNLAIWLPYGVPLGVETYPFYGVNYNLSHADQVWTLGDFGPILVTANIFSIVAPYGTYGPSINGDGNLFSSCNFLTYGIGPALYLDAANNIQVNQTYCATIFGGALYAGFDYAVYMNNCRDCYLKLEVDYYPCPVQIAGTDDSVRFDGSTFPNTTPIGPGIPIVGFLNAIALTNTHFNMIPLVDTIVNDNYHFASPGGFSPALQYIRNSSFFYDAEVNDKVLFVNATADFTAPFWSVRLEGETDTITTVLQVNGAAAGASAYRMFVNGLVQGSA